MTILEESPPRTQLRPPTPTEAPERRRSTATLRLTDYYAIAGALLAAVCFSGILFTIVLPWSGAIGFVAVTYVTFLVTYALLVSLDENGPTVRDKIASVFVHSLAFLMLL